MLSMAVQFVAFLSTISNKLTPPPSTPSSSPEFPCILQVFSRLPIHLEVQALRHNTVLRHLLFHSWHVQMLPKCTESQHGIPRTNVPGLYIAIFRIYLLLCSYVLCAEIYFSTTSQPAPTEPW